MCCAEFIVRTVLIIANIVFAVAGLVITGLGIAVHLQIKDVVDLFPVNLTALSVGIIVLGLVVFIISYLACCGAIRKSRCMLICYVIFMLILAAFKIYFTVVIFNFLDRAQSTVSGWLVDAFANASWRPAYNVMESMFKCCGTTGPESYTTALIPPSCCAAPVNNVCAVNTLYSGCISVVTDYSETFGEAIGGVLIAVIIVELLCAIFGWFLSSSIRKGNY